MTYNTKTMDDSKDSYGLPWRPGTFRIWHNNDKLWSVSSVFDVRNRGTAYVSWYKYGGEFFDGQQWRPLSERNEWLQSGGKEG